jgi:hypothetical protein
MSSLPHLDIYRPLPTDDPSNKTVHRAGLVSSVPVLTLLNWY